MVSVIIPAYNIEKYIKKCADSILNQSYKDIEVIFIDDGSTDRTREILEKAAGSDDRVKIIDGGHHGVSNARNLGLDQAKGEYVTFVDGDDFIDEDYVKTLLMWLNDNEVDIAIGGTADYNESYEVIKRSEELEPVIETRDEFVRNIVICKKYTCVVWGKMYKREAIGDIRFDTNIEIAEDFEFLYRVAKNINRVYYNPQTLYNWLLRARSALHTARSTQVIKSLSTHEMIMSELEDSSPIMDSIVEGYVNMCMECMKLAREEHNHDIKKICKNKVHNKMKLYMKNRNVPKRRKLKDIAKLILY